MTVSMTVGIADVANVIRHCAARGCQCAGLLIEGV
jgi:hypothetical protein